MNINFLKKGHTNYIFDFDGTISDTLKIHEKAFKDALNAHSVNYLYSDYLGQTTESAVNQILKKNKIVLQKNEISEIISSKRKFANDLIKTDSTFINGAEAFLKMLYARNNSLYIASSGSKLNVEEGLWALKIYNYFTGVITANDVNISKPDPEIYNTVTNRFSLQKENSIVFEDALSGIQSALAAGLKVICVNPEINTSIFSVDNVASYTFIELLDFINNEK